MGQSDRQTPRTFPVNAQNPGHDGGAGLQPEVRTASGTRTIDGPCSAVVRSLTSPEGSARPVHLFGLISQSVSLPLVGRGDPRSGWVGVVPSAGCVGSPHPSAATALTRLALLALPTRGREIEISRYAPSPLRERRETCERERVSRNREGRDGVQSAREANKKGPTGALSVRREDYRSFFFSIW